MYTSQISGSHSSATVTYLCCVVRVPTLASAAPGGGVFCCLGSISAGPVAEGGNRPSLETSSVPSAAEVEVACFGAQTWGASGEKCVGGLGTQKPRPHRHLIRPSNPTPCC